MLQIQLGPDREIEDEVLGRPRIGYRQGMTEEEAWEAARGTWKLNPDRALEENEVQVVNPDGFVVAVARILGISKTQVPGRYAIQGELLVGDQRVGKPTTTPHRSRNPVAYF
jgi:hypothetical protein